MELLCSSASALHPDLCPHLDTVCIGTQRETQYSHSFLSLFPSLDRQPEQPSESIGGLMPSDVSALLISPPVDPRLSRPEPRMKESDDHLHLPAHLNFDRHLGSPHSTPLPPPR